MTQLLTLRFAPALGSQLSQVISLLLFLKWKLLVKAIFVNMTTKLTNHKDHTLWQGGRLGNLGKLDEFACQKGFKKTQMLFYPSKIWTSSLTLFPTFWLIGLKSQWAYLIINHKLCTICLWTHSDGAHGGRYTLPLTYPHPPLPLPTPTHPYPYPPLPLPTPVPTPTPTYPHPPLPLPTPTHPYPYLPPPTPTLTYPHPTPTPTHPYPYLPLPTPTHPYPYPPLPPPTPTTKMVLKEANS